ncbi:Serine/threonine-protein phosphatase 7 long form [Glycine soja]
MLQSVIEVSLQGSDVVAGSNSIETDPGVSPLHSHVVADDPEVVLDALLGQPMLELNISRLESIYEATKSISFDAMKFLCLAHSGTKVQLMVDKSVLIPKADCYKGKEKMHSQHDMLKQDQADSSNMKWLLYIKNRNLQVEGGNLYKGIMDFEPIPLVWNLRRSHHQIEFIPRQVAAIRLSITIPLWLIHHPTTFTFVHHVQPIIEEVNSNDEIPIVVVDMTMEVYNDPPPSLEYARQPRCAGKRHSHWRVLLDLKALVPLALRASSFFINCVWLESFSLRFRVCRVKKYCVKRVLGSMASSSSCSSSIQTRSGPIDSDVLWMQPKHVSEHVWNGEPDRKLHIRRAVPTYQGEEQIPEEIVPLLRQCGFYWIMRMRYLKINAALISAFIERWRPETHMFHLRCGEATITLQDVSVLLGLHSDGAPLIGSTNLVWADLCEELLGEGETEGSVVKLSWLAHHFSHINIDEGNVEQLQRFTRAWILRFIGGVLFVNKSSSRVSLRYLQFLRDFEQCSTYAWGPAVLAYLYREMCSTTDYKVKSIGGMCILIQMWAWERCTTLAPKRTPPVIENKPLGHRWLRRGNQHIGNDDLRLFCRKLDLMKRHEFVWESYTTTVMVALPPICVVGSVAWFAVVPLTCFHVVEWHQPDRVLRQFGLQQPIPGVDVYPRQEGLLGYNSDYMVWYRHKTKMFVDPNNANTAALGEVVETLQYMVSPQGRNTWTVDDLVPYVDKLAIISEEQERITEPVSYGPASEREFPAQEFPILQSSVETRGIGRRREPVEAEEYSQQMMERGYGMYYTPATFSEYPSQMYQYPFAGHHTDTSETSHSFGGVAENQPHFSWPTMTPSQQHDAPMATPNAPFSPQ